MENSPELRRVQRTYHNTLRLSSMSLQTNLLIVSKPVSDDQIFFGKYYMLLTAGQLKGELEKICYGKCIRRKVEYQFQL